MSTRRKRIQAKRAAADVISLEEVAARLSGEVRNENRASR
jgi:hypothetical protein